MGLGRWRHLLSQRSHIIPAGQTTDDVEGRGSGGDDTVTANAEATRPSTIYLAGKPARRRRVYEYYFNSSVASASLFFLHFTFSLLLHSFFDSAANSGLEEIVM